MSKQPTKKSSENEEHTSKHTQASEEKEKHEAKSNGNGHSHGHETAHSKKAEQSSSEERSGERQKHEEKHRGRPRTRPREEDEDEREAQSRGLRASQERYNRGHSEEEKYTTYDYDRDQYGRSDRRRSMRRYDDNNMGYRSEAGGYEGRQPREPYHPEMEDYQGESRREYADDRYGYRREWQPHSYAGYSNAEYPRMYGSRYGYDPRPEAYASDMDERYPSRRREEYRTAPYHYVHSDWYGDTRPSSRERQEYFERPEYGYGPRRVRRGSGEY